MMQQITGIYGKLRAFFGLPAAEGRGKDARKYPVKRFPEDLWKLDESYQNLMRELSKR